MNTERLTHLISVMESVKGAALPFHLREWGGTNTEHPCGTVACACGYAGLDRTFQEQGFKLELMGYERGKWVEKYPSGVPEFNKMMANGSRRAIPSFQGETNWAAVRPFFGIIQSTAENLFSSFSSKETPDTIIDRLMRLLEVGEAQFNQERAEGAMA